MHRVSPIAVVAMDGIFPGAPNLDVFWQNMIDGIDQSAPVPEQRWIAATRDRLSTTLKPDRTYSRHACLIHDFTFDPNHFNLDPNVTRHLDPVHHLTLAAGKRAVGQCRTTAVDFDRVDTILAAIALPTDSASAFSRLTLGKAIERRLFPQKIASPTAVTRANALASRVDGLPAALLAAEMEFGGDSFTLDAACASSIYAVKLACDALTAGRADMVVTGGVSRPECLYTQTGFSQLQALSRTGRCAPFDRSADGLVVGEGVGILVLKRLTDAVDQGDVIHGVIHGIGLSNDLRGNLLAPERRGQLRAMQAAYRSAGWQPSTVDYIECHGTGTRAGDTTEIESLINLWTDEPSPSSPCAIGSVKSMIGHLLTAAGAAGMIKTLLGMHHRTLPPSINFEKPPDDSPLKESPFRVQTTPRPWEARNRDGLRRAAVSAFGFGGINAHILFQEFPAIDPDVTKSRATAISVSATSAPSPPNPVAIVGMDVIVGGLNHLNAFDNAVFHGHSAVTPRPEGRWKGADAALIDAMDGIDPYGAYIDRLDVGIGEFQIPPNEIGDILPQQLLALKTGAGALTDAGLPLHHQRERMGVVVGIGFDFEATNYHLRWQLYPAVSRWNATQALNLDHSESNRWLEALREQCSPPLTPPRVMGALGGIVASRMAREFRLGGPSFVVSADSASGIKSLQIAMDLLNQGAVDAMLVGAVDLAAEGRNVVRMSRLLNLSGSNRIRPFDPSADGTLPGDGAVALVLKRLDRARRDEDRIYAVLGGIGSAGGDLPSWGRISPQTYRRSLSQACRQAGIAREAVSYIEAHATGIADLDRVELEALNDVFGSDAPADMAEAIALGATAPVCGHTGTASGLISVAKAALCLHHRRLAPLSGSTGLMDLPEVDLPFHLPAVAQPWYRDREAGPRTACCASISMDGTCSHVVLQEYEDPSDSTRPATIRRPWSVETALFVLTGDDPSRLAVQLSELDTHLASTRDTMPLEASAVRWTQAHPPSSDHRLAMGLILRTADDQAGLLKEARQAIEKGNAEAFSKRVFYTDRPMGPEGRIAWIYPGSGNHYLGMGRELALRFPDVVERMDRKTARLKTQFRPWRLMPWRRSWPSGWATQANTELTADPLNMIFGQVVFGSLMAGVLKRFSIPADAIVGYSLGESAALFAHGVWSDRGDMLARMQATDLFTTQLAGPCRSLRQAWRLPEDAAVRWRVAVVNRPADRVRRMLDHIEHLRLLIVNTPDECVIGGLAPAVAEAIDAMACQAVYLDGVVTVHCDAAVPVADAYRQLHHFPTTTIPGLTVYSCSRAEAYAVSPDSIADSIKKQAVEGFDFTQTINQTYSDGCRIFLEVGPRASCSRMIDRILADRPHLAVAANRGTGNEIDSLLRCLARLITERVPLDMTQLYSSIDTCGPTVSVIEGRTIEVPVGGQMLRPTLPDRTDGPADESVTPDVAKSPPPPATPLGDDAPKRASAPPLPDDPSGLTPQADRRPRHQLEQLLEAARRNIESTATAHQQFLALSQELNQAFADTFELQNRLLGHGARPARIDPRPQSAPAADTAGPVAAADMSTPDHEQQPAFDRDMCMEFAIGSVGRMLGPAFEVVDTYPVRVRLPDEPLMLVDRILSVQGEKLSMGSGQVVTEHDVLPGAWYLDGDRAPVCISVEAGQADLFLSAYLGIDHQVKGERAYRLLDAVVTFHRGLPRPGDTIRYEIAIDRFVRQGETWMFFFRFEGFIGGQHLITMRDGCAGFFTEEEVRNSGGIILTDQERAPVAGKRPSDWRPLVPMQRESYSDQQVDALRRGDLAGCFGRRFEGIRLSDSLHLPDGRMRLIHRVLELDPEGGRYGLGLIRAEADIHPDDWFLTCHFVDDMVMPGTLMYECCAHTLRVFLQRMGWVTDRAGVCYEPVIGNGARLKCRGPVTPNTRQVHYEIQISRIGYGPEPFAVADAHMFADGQPIVFFKDMSMKMTGLDRKAVEALWRSTADIQPTGVDESTVPAAALYDQASILAFATGNPSEAFGGPYRVFDHDRKIARLPGPPYCFMNRVIHLEPEPWQLKPGGWVTAQYDIPATEWYFAADRSGVMPFCVLLEIALQPCGWLAAYAGSALRSDRDLKFRNLGGSAELHRQVTPGIGTLTMRSRMTKVSEAADMIIENFDFEVLAGDAPVYTGDTYFGFFSAEALNQQKGLGAADPMVRDLAAYAGMTEGARSLSMTAPLTPDDGAGMPVTADRLELPGKALLMIDAIDAHLPDAGEPGMDYIRGTKQVDPDEWFFKAHFYQDPVCPGSLGIESFLQLIKIVAMKRWPQLMATHRFRLVENSRHKWTYRGQIIPANQLVTVEARITRASEGASPIVRADGLLSVDGLPIYKMENFELGLVPATEAAQS